MSRFADLLLQFFVGSEAICEGAALPVSEIVMIAGKAPALGILFRPFGKAGASIGLKRSELRDLYRFAGGQNDEQNSGEDGKERFHSDSY